MYTFVFYAILASIIVSLYAKYNPNFLSIIENKFQNKNTIEKVENKVIEKYSYQERVKRGDYFLDQGFVNLASTEYSNALLEEDNQEAYIKLAKAQLLLGNIDKAEQNLLTAAGIFGSDNNSIELAKIKIKKLEFKQATDLISKTKINSDEKLFYSFLLGLLKKDFDKSKLELKEIYSQIKSNEIKDKLSKINDAFLEFNSYKESKKEHLVLLISKSLIQIDEFEISLKLASDVVQEKDNYRDAWIIIGYNYMRIGDNEKALKNLEKAYSLDPIKPETMFYLGLIYENLDKKVIASEYYQKALNNNYEPRSHIIQHLAELSAENGNDELAVKMYKEMLALNSDDIKNFYYPIDISINKLKDYKLALKFAQWAERRHPDKAYTYSLLGLAYFVNDDLENSKIYIQKSISLDDSIPNNYLYAGMISEKIGELITALKQYSIAYRKDTSGKIGREAIEKYNKLLSEMN